MQLLDIRAVPHPKGNRIDLAWAAPEGASFDGVLIRRSATAYPGHPEDGEFIAKVTGVSTHADEGLKSEEIYYYALFPYSGTPAVYVTDRRNVIFAMATGPYGSADQMYDLLPRIYHRYDTTIPQDPTAVQDEDRDKGQLRRFLDIVGGEFDQFQSFAKAVLDFHDPHKLDGSLLPLLAQWIGWDTDFRLRFSSQRNEVSNAPFLYERIGIVPTVEATVKRLIGWESRTKEFFGNVFLTNRPEQLNTRMISRTDGKWASEGTLISLDYRYEGSASVVSDKDGNLQLYYHTQRGETWDVWCKEIDKKGTMSPGVQLSDAAGVAKYPSAAYGGDTLWLFWNELDELSKTWRIVIRRKINSEWQQPEELPGTTASQKFPISGVDADGGLWLFRVEQDGLKYRKYDNGWNVPDVIFPDDGGKEPVVEADPFVLPLKQEKAIYFFWARREDAGQRKVWTIAYRKKGDLSAGAGGWGPVNILPKQAADRDDREPAAVLNESGEIELFWSSNRSGNWTVWRSVLEDPLNGIWSAAEQVLPADSSQRAPLPVMSGSELRLFYGSNEGVRYQSSVYTATETTDNRYAGSTTVDVNDARKNNLQGDYADFATYTYDTGRTQSDWYARDTVGVYLTPDTDNQELISRNLTRLGYALSKFLPIQTRPVFIIETPVYREIIYSKDPEKGRDIGEYAFSEMEVPAGEAYAGMDARYADSLPDWTWMFSAESETGEYIDHRTGDLSAQPPVTRYRTWHTGINRGG